MGVAAQLLPGVTRDSLCESLLYCSWIYLCFNLEELAFQLSWRCLSGIWQRWVNLVSSLNNKNRPRKLLFCVTRACKFHYEEASWYIRLSHMCWPFCWVRILYTRKQCICIGLHGLKPKLVLLNWSKKLGREEVWVVRGVGARIVPILFSGLFGLTFWRYVVFFFFQNT